MISAAPLLPRGEVASPPPPSTSRTGQLLRLLLLLHLLRQLLTHPLHYSRPAV